jgi:hypothetical protein
MPSEEQDFYGDNPPEQKECRGYCIYCKDEVYEGDDVEYKNFLYHKDCFILEQTGMEPGIND